MRISTVTLNQVSANYISDNQSSVYKYEQQVASGKRINTAADDPVGAVRAAELTSALAANTQYASNITTLNTTLASTESTVGSMNDMVVSIQDLLTKAGNGSLSASDKQTLAESLSSNMNQLLSLANTRDSGTGAYLFSGFADNTAPFSLTTTGATYNGDTGVKQLAVSSSLSMAMNVPGSSLLMSARSGNGVIQTAASSSNAGTGLIDGGQVLNATAYDDSSFSVSFSTGSSGLEYSVVNTTTGATVLSNQAYTSGTAIQIPSTASGSPVLSVTVSGAPSSGDSFTLSPSTTTDPFSTITSVVNALNNNANGTITNSQLTDVLRQAGANMSQIQDKLLSVRGSLGNSMNELDTQSTLNSDQNTSLTSSKSDIVNADYVQSASDLSQAQLAYQASLSAYSAIAKKSLFDYL